MTAHPERTPRPEAPLITSAARGDAALLGYREKGEAPISLRAAVHAGAAIDQRAAIGETAAVGGSVQVHGGDG